MISELLPSLRSIVLILFLSSPHRSLPHPFSTIYSANGDASIHRPGPSIKEWRLNTNFDNLANWQGLRGHENCTKNIYEFPGWYGDEVVVTLPRSFVGEQIILPINGHFVFREGVTRFSGGGGDTCRGREVKFTRTTQASWHDPHNWIQLDSTKSPSNSLNQNTGNDDTHIYEATPHVERVPCQYDSVRFPGNSSFNLKISSNVTIAGFFLGDEKHNSTDLTSLINSPLGKLQFRKHPSAFISISDSPNASSCTGSNEEITDSDRCICANYNRELRQQICALADCPENDDECPDPITPHGFCCPICGFHIKIRHSGNLRLVPLHSKLKGEITRANLEGKVRVHVTRYKERSAHIIVLSGSGYTSENSLLLQIGKLVLRIESILNKEESEVIGVTLTESWGELLPSGESTNTRGSSDRLEGSGLGGGLITLIVFLLLVGLLGGIALFIFVWNKKHGYPPLTLSSVTSAFPRMPSMRIPIVPGGGGRRSSIVSSSLQSFGFARFTNERVSSVTIGRAEGDGECDAVGKSISIRRTEQVDEVVDPESEKVTDSGAFGFTDVTYDLVGGVDSEELKGEPRELLSIPEVTVVDMDENTGSTSGEATTVTKSTTKSINNGSKEEKSSKNGKFSKPSFIASRMASAYRKLDDQKSDAGSSGSGESSGKKLRGGDEGKVRSGEGIPVAGTSERSNQQSGQVDGHEDLGVFQEFISVAEDTLAAAATASGHVEEGKIIDFEE